jgi:hypothetical protein
VPQSIGQLEPVDWSAVSTPSSSASSRLSACLSGCQARLLVAAFIASHNAPQRDGLTFAAQDERVREQRSSTD